MTFQQLISFSLLLVGFGSALFAADPLEYNRDIRPILADNCFACHGADSAARKADLRLDQREDAIELGAITAGNLTDSELIARIITDDADLVMPPAETKKTLTAEQIEMLKRWVTEGANYEPHWSLILPQKIEPTAVKNQKWSTNAIDNFVLAKLEANGLMPAPEADARTLFRRLHLDITGLPPSPKDVAAFVDDYEKRKDVALSDWIDKLMQTPAWGEHRGRYWLDAARYADTHGLHFDNYREMWPYRDWVIRSFNANQPFDQFTVEQFAGDLLPNPTEDQLIATGFQRCNITTNEGGTIDEENLANYAVDRVQTFGWVFLGMTTNCGQCHDHKFDPFTSKDFYSLAAFFRNTTQGPKDGNVKDGRGPILVVPSKEDRSRWQALPEEIITATSRRNERKKTARGKFNEWLATATPESLESDVPSEGIVVNVPLNEGKGNEVANRCDPSETVKAAGEVTWAEGGKLGPAPVIKAGSTFDLGQAGDFERAENFSYGAWVKPADDNSSAAILGRMDEKAAHRGWDLWKQGRSVSVHIIDSWPGNGLKVTTNKSVLKAGQWAHVFATYDGSGKPEGIKIYVNGKEEPHKTENKTLTAEASIHTETPLRIGQRSEGAVFNGGAVQDVRIYSRKLETGEVQALATVIPLQSMLSVAADKRTKEQNAALYDHYLINRDSEYPALVKAVVDLTAEKEAIRARSPITHIQVEKKDSPAMAHILMRGEYDRPGEEVKAATPAALHPFGKESPNNRLGLAQWLVDPANPLTVRVTVNRFWQQIFGQGFVTTTEDFGVMGALPSHPKLLDWLAVDFRENGWDVKRLFKQMLMSSTYRQAAVITPLKLEKDRDNSLLSRGPRYRMDAEMVRDNALAVSGLLSSKMYGPGVKPYQPEAIWDVVGLPSGNTRDYVQDTGENLYRRTIYTFWKRMAPPPNLDAFNAPSREFCTVRRERTNTPLQALVTLNDTQFIEAARNLAQSSLQINDDARTIRDISLRVLSRPLSEKEQAILLANKTEFLTYYQANADDAKVLVTIGETKRDEKIDAATLAAWTLVCNQIMNLDETFNK